MTWKCQHKAQILVHLSQQGITVREISTVKHNIAAHEMKIYSWVGIQIQTEQLKGECAYLSGRGYPASLLSGEINLNKPFFHQWRNVL